MVTEPSVSQVSEQDVAGYWKNGWLVLRRLFTATEAAAWDAECKRLLSLDLVNPDNLRTGFRVVNGKPMIERYDPIIDVSSVFNSVVNDERILSPLRAIFKDEPALFKDKLIFKLPGMSGYGMHQDQSWWQMCAADDILSVSVAIDGASTDNGSIELFPGYHGKLLSPKAEFRNMNDEEAKAIDLSTGQLAATKPGDVLIFHSQTPHRSGTNISQTSRRNLYLTYTASRTGNLYAAHRDHYKTYITAKMSAEDKARKYFK
jgi:ectoine hydroxylase-related dioxygenase (phytanoyl-CoA dioxygenase family)